MPHETIPQQCYTRNYLRILHTYDIYHHKPAATFLKLSSHGTFAYDVYKEFQRKEQTQAVVVDMEDAYNSVQFKLLMELLVQYDVSLTITRWLAAALQERKVAMRIGNWISTPQQLTMGLLQDS